MDDVAKMEEIKKYYQDIVPFDIAVALNEAGYHQNRVGSNDAFAYAMHDGFKIYPRTKEQILKKGTSFRISKLSVCKGNFVAAPKWSEVLDWLMDKGIAIGLSPGFTFALQSRMGFEYTIYKIIESEGTIQNYLGKDFASFGLTMHDAVEHALKILKDNEEKNWC